MGALEHDHRLRIAMGASWTLERRHALIFIGGNTFVLGHSQSFNLHIRGQVRDMLVDEVVKGRQVAYEGHNDLDLDTPKLAYVLQFDYIEHIVKSQEDAQNVREREKNDGSPHDPLFCNELRLPILNQLDPRANVEEAKEQNKGHCCQLVDVNVVVCFFGESAIDGIGQRNEQCRESYKEDARATVEPFNPPLHLDDLLSQFVGRLTVAVNQFVQFTQPQGQHGNDYRLEDAQTPHELLLHSPEDVERHDLVLIHCR